MQLVSVGGSATDALKVSVCFIKIIIQCFSIFACESILLTPNLICLSADGEMLVCCLHCEPTHSFKSYMPLKLNVAFLGSKFKLVSTPSDINEELLQILFTHEN